MFWTSYFLKPCCDTVSIEYWSKSYCFELKNEKIRFGIPGAWITDGTLKLEKDMIVGFKVPVSGETQKVKWNYAQLMTARQNNKPEEPMKFLIPEAKMVNFNVWYSDSCKKIVGHHDSKELKYALTISTPEFDELLSSVFNRNSGRCRITFSDGTMLEFEHECTKIVKFGMIRTTPFECEYSPIHHRRIAKFGPGKQCTVSVNMSLEEHMNNYSRFIQI